ARRSHTGRFTDHELVLAARIRKPRDLCSVRRPHWPTIVRARTLREIAKIAFLRRHGENLAPGFKRDANSRWRERRVANHARDFLELRSRPRQISSDFDIDLVIYLT